MAEVAMGAAIAGLLWSRMKHNATAAVRVMEAVLRMAFRYWGTEGLEVW